MNATAPLPMGEYRSFVIAKSQIGGEHGFARTYRNPHEFDFQSHLIDWACRQGRSAVFADCGLGKTLMQLVWAENVHRHTNKPVLIMAPLSVSSQTVEEAAKFGMEAVRVSDGRVSDGAGIVTTNYERLKHFDPDVFGGVVCDESSILKNFDGAFKASITEFMRRCRYRAMFTATPSPNDYIELGTSSEALGYLGYMDMLGTFFKNDEDSLHPGFIGSAWRFKPHGERDFWRWVSSWARAIRKPSDMGFDDRGWTLPPMVEVDHEIASPPLPGMLFAVPAKGLDEQRAERKATVTERCEKAASILAASDCGVSWCHLNEEADTICRMVPGAVNLSGSDPDEEKEEKFRAFRAGQIRHLVTKPKIAALGVNWQHAATATYFTDYSFEQYYQAVRRMWRFGQTRPVTIHNISTESLRGVAASRKTKAEATDRMFKQMVGHMRDAMNVERYKHHTRNQEMPSWL
jgi:hypothetical protein